MLIVVIVVCIVVLIIISSIVSLVFYFVYRYNRRSKNQASEMSQNSAQRVVRRQVRGYALFVDFHVISGIRSSGSKCSTSRILARSIAIQANGSTKNHPNANQYGKWIQDFKSNASILESRTWRTGSSCKWKLAFGLGRRSEQGLWHWNRSRRSVRLGWKESGGATAIGLSSSVSADSSLVKLVVKVFVTTSVRQERWRSKFESDSRGLVFLLSGCCCVLIFWVE